jgi:hypothetical protein
VFIYIYLHFPVLFQSHSCGFLQEWEGHCKVLLESQNSTGLFMEFGIPVEWAQNIMGIAFLLLCLVSPYRVPPYSVKKIKNPWKIQWNSMGPVKIP